MSSLYQLIRQKDALLEVIEQDEGIFQDETLKLWNELESSLSEKVDNYGHFIESLEDRITRLKKNIERNRELIHKAEAKIDSLKRTLNNVSDEQVMRGTEFSFDPYVSVKRSICDLQLVEPDYKKYTVKLNYFERKLLLEIIHPQNFALLKKIRDAKESCNVTDLPEDHAAIVKELNPTVTVRTIKGKENEEGT